MIVLYIMFHALFAVLPYFAINHDYQDTLTADWQQKEKFRGVSGMTELSLLPQKITLQKGEIKVLKKKMQAEVMSLLVREWEVTKSFRRNKNLSKTLPSILKKPHNILLRAFFVLLLFPWHYHYSWSCTDKSVNWSWKKIQFAWALWMLTISEV